MLPGAARINVRKTARYAGRDCGPLHHNEEGQGHQALCAHRSKRHPKGQLVGEGQREPDYGEEGHENAEEIITMMTDEELLADLRSRQGYESATGPDVVDGRKYFRIQGLPVPIERVREIVGDVED
jgi:hypothetical protein